MPMSSVSRFGLVFYSKTDEAAAGLEKMQQKFSNMELSLLALQGTADHVFQTISNSLFSWGKTLVDSAAKIETTKAQFQFAFKDLPDKGAAAFDKAIDAGLRMVQTTDEVINMATLMQRMTKVNIFDPKVEETMRKVNKEGLQFIDILGDMAAVNHYGVGGVTYALSEALTGQWRGFMMRMDMGKEEVEKYKKAVVGAKDNTEKLARMAPLLMQRFGGAAFSMKDTWKFLTAQLSDYKDKLFSTLGKPLMDALKPGLKALNDYMVDPQKGLLSKARIGELDKIVGVFASFGTKLASVVRLLGTAAKYAIDFVKTHPDVLKWAMGLTVATAAFAGFVAMLIATKVAVAAVGVAFGSATVPVLLVMGALAAGTVALAKWAVDGKSLAETWRKWATIGAVVADVLTTMDGKIAKIGKEHAKAASEQGVLGLAIKMGMLAYRVKEFFTSFWTGLKDASGEMKASFLPVFNQVAGLFKELGGAAGSGTSRWQSAGAALADIVVKLVKGFAWLLDVSVRFGLAFGGTLKAVGGLVYAMLIRPFVHLAGHFDSVWGKLKSWVPWLGQVKGGFADIAGVVAGIGVSILGMKKAAGMFGVDLKGTVAKLMGKGGIDALSNVQKVFVVNMPGGGLGGLGGKSPLGIGGLPGNGVAEKGMGLLGKAGLVGGAFAGGWAIGDFIANLKDSSGKTLADAIGDKMFNMFGASPNKDVHAVDADAARRGEFGAKAQETQRYLDARNASNSPAAQIKRSIAAQAPNYTFDPAAVEAMRRAFPIGEGAAPTMIAKLYLDGKQISASMADRAELNRLKGMRIPNPTGADGVPIDLAR